MSKTIIREIGALVSSFKEENLLILFGLHAPPELREISVIHEFAGEVPDEPLIEGGKIIWNDQEYSITAVGSAANKNLKELGHISIYFSAPNEHVLPGAVFVEPFAFPSLEVGKEIRFEK
jgi:glucitol/sorbitol PTS system EIIA component